MDQAVIPGCAHHMFVGKDEPTTVCACPAGLVHMHDCPVTFGRECVHFAAAGEAPSILDPGKYESMHEELMDQFLTRPYVHRIRSLDPAGDEWSKVRDELHARYSDEDLQAGDDEAGEISEEEYERERERRLEQRRKREEARREREEAERAEKEARARELAERAIKAAEERARREAAQPKSKKKRRRRRRGPKPAAEGEAAPKPAAEGQSEGQEPRKRRRRRRRRRRPGGGSGDASS